VRALLVACALVLLSTGCGPRDVQTPDAPLGAWQGTLSWRGERTPLSLEVSRAGESLAVLVSAPALGVSRLDAGALAFTPPRVRFTIPDSSGPIAFEGWLRRGVMVGALASTSLIAERNPSRLPLVTLSRVRPRHPLPFPREAGSDSFPPPPPAPERSIGAWLRSRAGALPPGAR